MCKLRRVFYVSVYGDTDKDTEYFTDNDLKFPSTGDDCELYVGFVATTV